METTLGDAGQNADMTYAVNVGKNGWVTLPREVVSHFSGGVLYISIDITRSIRLYTDQEFDDLINRVNDLPRENKRMLRPLLTYAAKCEITKKGSICIMRYLREYAFNEGGRDVMLLVKDGVYLLCERCFMSESLSQERPAILKAMSTG